MSDNRVQTQLIQPRSRRAALRGGLWGAAGLSGAFLLACGGGEKKEEQSSSSSVATVPVSAAATTAAGQEPKRGGEWRYSGTGVFAGVDPHNSVYGGSVLVPQAYSYLARTSILAPDRGVLPDLAMSWEQSPDKLTTIFKLRPDAMIAQNSRGVPVRPMEAEDVKMSFERVADPAAASNGYSWMNTWVDKMETPDKTTFRITTKKPYAWVLNNVANNLYSAVVPREWLMHADLKKWAVGSGPFTLESLEESSLATMKRNPSFWDKPKPYLDSISYRLFADRVTWRTAFSANQHDYYVPLNSDEAKELIKTRKDAIHFQQPSMAMQSFWMNIKQQPWGDQRLRKAMRRAMNPQEFIDVILRGDGVIIGPMSYAMGEYALPSDEVKKLWPYNPQEAKQLIQAAGLTNLVIKPTFAPNLSENEVTVYQRQLAAADIKLEAQPLDAGTWLADFFNSKPNSTFHTNQEYANPDFQLQWHHTGGITGNGRWYNGYSDPAMDVEIEKAAGIFDEAERKKAYLDVQRKIISIDPPHFHFYAYKQQIVTTGDMMNYHRGIGSLIFYYYRDFWLNR